MTTSCVKDFYGRYLDWHQSGPIKELGEITVEDFLQVYQDEIETARDLETERQIDLALLVKENEDVI